MTQAVLARARKVTPTGRKQRTYRLPQIRTYVKFRKFRIGLVDLNLMNVA